MAEEITEPTGAPFLWHMIGFLFLLFVVVAFFTEDSIYKFEENRDTNLDSNNPDITYSYYDYGDSSDLTYKEKLEELPIFSKTDLEEGVRIINKKIVDVRLAPAGSIIGEQLKRVIGIVKEGPFEKLGTGWVRVDYKDAPDGWVDVESLSANIWGVRLLNIFPILYEFLKPILIGVMIVVALFIIWIRIKFNGLLERESKKRELVMRQHGLDDESNIVEPEKGGGVGNAPMNLPTGDSIPIFGKAKSEPIIKNKRWEHVQKLINSRSLSDWKQAILEADIILDDMVAKMGYDGDNLGQRLKNIEESDFLTLNKAWEAHKVRNKIAHAGSDFVMSRNEADRVIDLYKQVFEEFYFI